MVVIIPNPNDELALVKLQEKLCKEYSSQADYLCKVFPLWISVPNTEEVTAEELKDFSKSIKEVFVQSPDESFECKVNLIFTDTEKKSTLQLLRSKGLKKISPQELPPVSLKKFRMGIIKQNSTNTVSITDSVWVKL